MDLAGEPNFYRRLVTAIDPTFTFVEACELSGAFSSRTEAVTVSASNGQVRTVVLRIHNGLHFVKNPNVTKHEACTLAALTSFAVRTPAALLVDDSCSEFPHPFLVTQFLNGEPQHSPSDVVDYSKKLGAQLKSIHAVDVHAFAFLDQQANWFEKKFAGALSGYEDTAFEQRLHSVLLGEWSRMTEVDSVLLHGDYWAGNVLWQDNEISGVVDWGDAALGDPLADVAYTRLELFWGFDETAVDAFMDGYAAPVDARMLALWDLASAYRQLFEYKHWGLPQDEEGEWRMKHRAFAERALAFL